MIIINYKILNNNKGELNENDIGWILGILFFLFGPAIAIILIYVNF